MCIRDTALVFLYAFVHFEHALQNRRGHHTTTNIFEQPTAAITVLEKFKFP